MLGEFAMWACASPFLAVASGDGSWLIVIALIVLAAFSLAVTVYLLLAPIPQWRAALERSELTAADLASELESLKVSAEQQVMLVQRQAAARRRQLDDRSTDSTQRLKRRIEQLEKESVTQPQLPALQARIRAAALERHVARRLQRRLEDRILQLQRPSPAVAPIGQQAPVRERNRLGSQLQDARLALHVARRTHARLLAEKDNALDAATKQLHQAARKLKDLHLQLHVQRRLQQRLEAASYSPTGELGGELRRAVEALRQQSAQLQCGLEALLREQLPTE